MARSQAILEAQQPSIHQGFQVERTNTFGYSFRERKRAAKSRRSEQSIFHEQAHGFRQTLEAALIHGLQNLASLFGYQLAGNCFVA